MPTEHKTKRYEIAGVAMNWLQLCTVRAFAREGYRVAGHNHGAVVLHGRDTDGGASGSASTSAGRSCGRCRAMTVW